MNFDLVVFGRTTLHRLSRTIVALTGAVAVCLGLVAVTAPPATAATTTTFDQPGDVFGGGPGLEFSSAGPMSVPGVGDQGPAAPWGSQIVVPYDAPVLDVTLNLVLTHTAPTDLDIMLVGPHGQQALVMSDAGDDGDVSNYDFVISDDAANPLPGNGPLVSLAYRPADYNGGSVDTFPAPAPAVSGNTALGIFDGTSAAGAWRLYVMDDAAVDVGSISSWSLTFALGPQPYPSTLSVAGQPAVSDVDVTLHGFTSTYPDDIDVLLVGPGGQQATLMSDTGGSVHVSDLTFEFDDEAAAPLADQGILSSGSFKPINYEAGGDYYGPNAPAPNNNTALSAFDGTNPNGLWQLYFRDDNIGDVTSITGWSLSFTSPDDPVPTGDTKGPRSVKTSPVSGAKGVKVSSRVKVTANESLKPGSVTGKTVWLKAKGSSHRIKASVAYRGVTRTIVLSPSSQLKHHTTYKVTVKGVRDKAGNVWDQKPGKLGDQALTYAFTTN